MPDVATIYMACNKVTGKSYIGFDSNWPRRQKAHESYVNNPDTYFHKSLAKYGKENFVWLPIYRSEDFDHTLKVMEPYFINLYNTYNNGYNLTLGGDGSLGYRPSKEALRKLSEAHKGKPRPQRRGIPISDEHKEAISKANSGRLRSEEAKKKTSESLKRCYRLGLRKSKWTT